MAPDQLSGFVDRDVARALYGVDGVAQVSRIGGIEAFPINLPALGQSRNAAPLSLVVGLGALGLIPRFFPF